MDYEKLREILPKVHTKWTVEDIALWLKFIGLQALYPAFKNLAIDGSCLSALTDQDMKEELGIRSAITIKKLSTWINVGIKEFDQYINSQVGFLRTQLDNSAEGTIANKQLKQPLQMKNSKKLIQKPGRLEGVMETQESPVLQRKESTGAGLEEKISQSPASQRPLNELLIQQSDGASSYYCLKEQGAKIGRHSTNKILILEESVSRYHAEIEYIDGSFYLRDVGSTTGTFIKIIDKIELRENMVIEMGSNQFEVSKIRQGEVTLKIVEGPNVDQDEIVMALKKGVKVNCGRKNTNQINFPEDHHLSNIHASFYTVQNKYYIEDLATTNGTWLRLSKQNVQSLPYLLKDKTVFKVGTTYTYTCTRNGSQTVEEKVSGNQCIICIDNEKDCVYKPCNHNAACIRCSKSLKECPLCRRKIEDFIKIYKT